MATSRTATINFSLTSFQGTTGAPTPATFISTETQPSVTVAAVLTEPSTTLTAFQVPSTTGLAVVDGTTLSWRHEGITLANGDVVSLGFNGLEDSTTTAFYGPITVSGVANATSSTGVSSTSQSLTTIPGTNTQSLTTIQGTHHTTSSGNPTGGAPSGSSSASAASSSSSGLAPTLGAGKTVALLGALGGMLAYGL